MGRADYERHAGPVEPDEAAEDVQGAAAEPAAASPDETGASGGSAASDHPATSGERGADDADAASATPSDDEGDVGSAGDQAEPAGETEAADPAADAAQARANEAPEVLAAELVEAERTRDQYLDLLQRERAEFENFRRRANRERSEALDRGAEGVVAALLGVLDNFGFVLDAAEQSEDTQLAKGVSMVHDELIRALQEAGLEHVPGAGSPFDPNHHDAMMQVEAEEEVTEPTVVEVLRPGYRFKGRVLRPASVSVAQ